MATIYEVLTELPAHVATAAGIEECSFKAIDSDVTLTTADSRIGHIDPSAGMPTITLPAYPYKGYTFTAQNITADMTNMALDGNGKDINGNPSLVFNGAYAARTVQYDLETNQYIVIRSVG